MQVQELFGETINEYGVTPLKLDLVREECFSDWNVYKGIIFHLISNAIKFSARGQIITVVIRFCKLRSGESPIRKTLRNYLETSIINFGAKFENKQNLRRFKTFAFGVSEQDDQ